MKHFLSKAASNKTLRLITGLCLLTILIIRSDLTALAHSMKSVIPIYCVIAILIVFVEIYLSALKLQLMLKRIGHSVSIGVIVKINFLSLFIGQFIPSQLSVDGVRIFYLSRHLGQMADSVSSIAIDRVINLIVLSAMAVVSYFAGGFYLQYPKLIWAILPMLFGSVLLVLLLKLRNTQLYSILNNRFSWSAKVVQFTDSLNLSLNQYGRSIGFIGFLVLFSIIFQSTRFSSSYFIARFMEIPVSYGYFYIIVPLVTILALLPFSFAGLGINQFSMVFFLEIVGIPTETAFGYSLFMYFFRMFLSLPGLVIFYTEGLNNMLKKKDSDDSANARDPIPRL